MEGVKRQAVWRQFVQHLPVAAALLDRGFRYVTVSPRWCQDFGLDAAQVTGKPYTLVFDDTDGYWQQAFQRVLQHGTAEGAEEAVLRRKDGRTFWVRWRAQPCPLSREAASGLILVLEDQTEAHQTREALALSQRLLSNLLSGLLEGVMALQPVCNLEGEIVDFVWLLANPRAHLLLGQNEPLVGRRLREVLPGHQTLGLFAAYTQVVRTGMPFQTTLYYDQDGLHTWFHLTATRVDEGVAVIFRDVSEALQAEQALRERERLFRLLTENMTDLVSLHDAEGRFVYVSPSAERITGYPPEALIGQQPEAFWHAEDKMRWGTLLQQVPSGEQPVALVHRFRHRKGHYIWLETHLHAIRDEKGCILQLQTNSRDVTARVQAEQELAQRNRELQEFAYVASHDLQEPLRKVRAFAELLKEEYAASLNEEGRYYLDRMQDAAVRMSRLIEDLLTLSRVTTQGRPFERVDLEVVLDQVLVDLEVSIAETGARIHRKGHWPVIEADPTQMRQLLQNLIGNALKFRHAKRTPEIWLRARVEPTAPGGPVCQLEVQDNGIGFDEKYLDRIFSPFQRLHSRDRYMGTGMGLAICRRIVERHHGHLTARSRPGEGATFLVTLPLYQPPTTSISLSE